MNADADAGDQGDPPQSELRPQPGQGPQDNAEHSNLKVGITCTCKYRFY